MTLLSCTRCCARGFTLIEVLLALTIFAMLGGAVFFSVRAVSEAAAILGREQMQARKEDAFLAWCRRGFRNLSPESQIVLRTRDGGAAGLALELLILRAPGAFSLGEYDARGGDVALAAIPDGRGGATFSLARFSGRLGLDESAKFLARTEWVPLLENIRTLRWTFWSPLEGRFVEQWEDGQGVPELIRVEMTMPGGDLVNGIFRTQHLAPLSVDPDADPEPTPEP